MKKLSIIAPLLLLSIRLVFAETNGQFEARVGQVNDRAIDFEKIVQADNYFKSVDFDTYVDSGAKVAAYAEFLSVAWDNIYQTWAHFRSNDWGNATTRRADAWHRTMESWDEWADKLTGKRTSDGKLWKEVYYAKKSSCYFSLLAGASRL